MLHQALDIEWVDIIGIKPRAGPQCGAEVLDELLECRVGGRSGRLICEGWRRCRAVFDIRHVDKYYMVRLWCGIGMSWSYRCVLGVLIKYEVMKLGVQGRKERRTAHPNRYQSCQTGYLYRVLSCRVTPYICRQLYTALTAVIDQEKECCGLYQRRSGGRFNRR